MSLQQLYLRFLAAPTEASLNPDAGFHYITTGISLSTPKAITDFLVKEQKILKQKSNKVLSSIQAGQTLVLEVETVLEFVTGAGHYLPGLDSNFVSDHTVVFPLVHFVNFDAAGKIHQVRLFWDQANLLKQVEVIGRTGRNWPIKDGREQIALITRSIAAAGSAVATSGFNSAASSNVSEVPSRRSSRASSSATRDPHATLSLFDSHPTEEEEEEYREVPKAPRSQSGYRPPSRSLVDIVGEPEQNEYQRPIPPKARSSFSKGQTFSLGEEDENTPKSHPKGSKTDTKKYQHFEFGNGEAAPPPVAPSPAKLQTAKKNGSSWGFEDFATPEKKPVRQRPGDRPTYTWSDNEEEVPPVKQPKKQVPRRDAESHFDITDEPTPAKNRSGNMQQAKKNTSKHDIDVDTFYGEDNNEDFWGNMGGEVQHGGIRIAGNGMGKSKTADIGEFQATGIAKVANPTFKPHEFGDEVLQRGIRIAGNGMGKSKALDRTDEFQASGIPKSTQPTFKQHEFGAEVTTPGIRIAGNGMGKSKALDRTDDFQASGISKSNQPTFTQHEFGAEVSQPGIRIAGNGMGKSSALDSTDDFQATGIPKTNHGSRKYQESHWEHDDAAPKKAAPGRVNPNKAANLAHWEHDDATPEKAAPGRVNPNKAANLAHWEHDDATPKKAASGRVNPNKAANLAHWEHDDATPEKTPAAPSNSAFAINKAANSNHWNHGDEQTPPAQQKPRKHHATTNQHWEMADESPAPKLRQQKREPEEEKGFWDYA